MRLGAAVSLGVLALVAEVPPATASVTLGQLPQARPGTSCAFPGRDVTQPTVTSGNTYVVPGAGTITSWSTYAATGGGQMLKLKIFHKVSDPASYGVVAHDGPRALTEGVVNGFVANIAVSAGDVLGLNSANSNTNPNGCLFSAAGDTYIETLTGDADDGATEDFFPGAPGYRVNVAAEFVPSNAFTLAGIVRNKKKGTATLTVNLPGPGELTATGKGVKSAGARALQSKTVTAPGPAALKIRAKGKKRDELERTGHVKLRAKVTFTPTGGDSSTQAIKLRLIKK